MNIGSITWDVARTGGLLAFLLLTASVAIGLLLGIGWRSATWTRFVTNEVHRFVTLLALVFTGIHTLAVAVDPFVKLSPPEVLVPFLSSYRPLWVALGIITTYLLIAIYLSERVRARIGYTWWRRFHVLAFAGYVMALVHGIATGSDTRAIWGIGLYVGSLAVVGGLLVVRMFPGAPRPSRPLAAVIAVVTIVAIGAFVFVGPLAPGWSVRAGGTIPGATLTDAATGSAASGSPAPSPSPAAASLGLPVGTALPFRGTARGDDDGGRIDITAQLNDGTAAFEVQLVGTADGGATGQVVVQTSSGETCTGAVTGVEQAAITADCQATSQAFAVRLDLAGSGRRLTGTMTLTAADGSAPAPGGQLPAGPGSTTPPGSEGADGGAGDS